MRITSLAVAAMVAMVLLGGCSGLQLASNTLTPDSGIRGRVLVDDAEAAGGVYVYAYDSPKNEMRVPTRLISLPTAPDGSYTLQLAPGVYHIVARKRLSGESVGYLGSGDFEGKYASNPVTVKAGEFATVDLSISALPGKFLLAPYAHQKGDMGFSGRVYRIDGTPVKGAYVMVYTRSDRIGRPAFLSLPTGKNGEYTVYLKKPGTYYVSARASHGDLPRKGEPFGTYDADPEHKVVIGEKSLLTGIDVTMNKFTRDLTKCSEH